jgi:hypothetical protein
LQQSLERWQIIFGTTAGILLIELVVYTLFASGVEQPWNRIFVIATDGECKHNSQKEDESDGHDEKVTVYNFRK